MSTLLSTAWTVLAPLGDPVPAPEDVKPGWIALFVVVALITVTVLLWFNMRKQIGKVKFDEGDGSPDVRGPLDETEAPRPGTGSNGSAPA